MFEITKFSNQKKRNNHSDLEYARQDVHNRTRKIAVTYFDPALANECRATGYKTF